MIRKKILKNVAPEARKRKKTKSLLNYYGFTPAEQKKYSVVSGILRELTPERIEK